MKKLFGFIVGPSGVGKGYGVFSILEEYFNSEAFVSGDWCRNHKKELSTAGDLVADDLIVAAGVEHYQAKKDEHGSNLFHFFLDAPRSLEQAKTFCELYLKWGASTYADIVTLHIHAKPKTCHDRIQERAKRQGREDDAKEDVVRKRLSIYFGNEVEVVSENLVFSKKGGVLNEVVPWLKKHTSYHHIDGDVSLEDIRNEVRLCLIPQLQELSRKRHH